MFFKEKVTNEQLDILYHNLIEKVHLFAIVTFGTAGIVYYYEKNSAILYWCLIVIALIAIRFGLIKYYIKSKERVNLFNLFLLFTFLNTFAYSSIFFIAFPKSEMLQSFLAFLIAGLSVGAIATLTYSKKAIISYELGLFMPPFIKFAFMEDGIYHLMALILLFFLWMLIKISLEIHRHYMEALSLQQEYLRKSQELFLQNQRFFHIYNHIPIGIFFYDEKLNITEFNNYLLKMLRIPHAEKEKVSHFNLNNLLDPRVIPAIKKVFQKEKGFYRGEYLSTYTKKKMFIEAYTSFVTLDGKIVEGLGVVLDLTQLSESQEEIERLAYYDELTSLAKRTLLIDNLKIAIYKLQRENIYSVFIYLDLDDFKDINDSLGHDIGDLYLKQIATILKSVIRDIDIVSRLGGDEFGILLQGISDDKQTTLKAGMEVAKRISKRLETPIKIGDFLINSSVSTGIVVIDETIDNAFDVIKFADIAMYKIKKEVKNGISIYNEALKEEIDRAYKTKEDLETAFAKREFELHFQPQFDKDENIVGAETLIRWNHPQKGLLYPADFLDIAAEFNMLPNITDEVLRLANEAFKKLPRKLPLGINISGYDIHDEHFVERLLRIIGNSDFYQYIHLEITEQILIKNLDKAIETISILNKQYQIELSLDDFGTGYSSLQYLKKLHISYLKIDMSFIRDILVDSNDLAIVKTIVNMAQSMHLKTVAEGVETREQFELLKTLGVDYFQGYYFSKPVAFNTFLERFLQQDSPHPRLLTDQSRN